MVGRGFSPPIPNFKGGLKPRSTLGLYFPDYP